MLDGTQKIILTTLEKEAIDYPSILGKHIDSLSLSQAFPWNYNHFIMCTTQLRKVASNLFIFIFIFYFYAYLPHSRFKFSTVFSWIWKFLSSSSLDLRVFSLHSYITLSHPLIFSAFGFSLQLLLSFFVTLSH